MASITDYFERLMRGAKVDNDATLVIAIFLGVAVLIILIARRVE